MQNDPISLCDLLVWFLANLENVLTITFDCGEVGVN